MTNVVWTNHGPCAIDGFDAVRARLRRKAPVTVYGVDKFPQDNVRTTDLRKKNMLLLQELEETKLKLETYERELSSSSSGLRPGGRQGTSSADQ